MSTVVADAVAGSSVDEVAVLRAELDWAQRRIAQLEADNDRLTGVNEELTATTERLAAEVAQLRERLEESRRAGKRQAAPFSRGTKKAKAARPGRKPGGEYGLRARRDPPSPERVDETVKVGLPEGCDECGGEVAFDKVVEQFQEEFVPAHARMRRYEIALGRCTGCRRRVRGRHPDQTSRMRWVRLG